MTTTKPSRDELLALADRCAYAAAPDQSGRSPPLADLLSAAADALRLAANPPVDVVRTIDVEDMVSGPYKYEKDLHSCFRVSIPGRDARLVACVYATAGEDQAEADAQLFARALAAAKPEDVRVATIEENPAAYRWRYNVDDREVRWTPRSTEVTGEGIICEPLYLRALSTGGQKQ